MTDRPIIFSALMIQSLLDGRKTQTRRVLKPQPDYVFRSVVDGSVDSMQRIIGETISGMESRVTVPLRFATGDRLWVRERWSGAWQWRDMKPSDRAGTSCPSALQAWYWADGSPECGDWEKPRPSIQMPRWASRLTLIVADVRVQRVQEISGEDARAEGALTGDHSVYAFSQIWNSIHGPNAWDQNPWVVALTFDVHRCNIDHMERPQ